MAWIVSFHMMFGGTRTFLPFISSGLRKGWWAIMCRGPKYQFKAMSRSPFSFRMVSAHSLTRGLVTSRRAWLHSRKRKGPFRTPKLA